MQKPLGFYVNVWTITGTITSWKKKIYEASNWDDLYLAVDFFDSIFRRTHLNIKWNPEITNLIHSGVNKTIEKTPEILVENFN